MLCYNSIDCDRLENASLCQHRLYVTLSCNFIMSKNKAKPFHNHRVERSLMRVNKVIWNNNESVTINRSANARYNAQLEWERKDVLNKSGNAHFMSKNRITNTLLTKSLLVHYLFTGHEQTFQTPFCMGWPWRWGTSDVVYNRDFKLDYTNEQYVNYEVNVISVIVKQLLEELLRWFGCHIGRWHLIIRE